MDAEYLDPAVFGDRGNAETFDAAMSRLSHHFAAKDAEIARLRAELESARAALAKEREACDQAREIIDASDYISRMHALGVEINLDDGVPMDQWTPPDHEAIADEWCRAHDARRAAEAKDNR